MIGYVIATGFQVYFTGSGSSTCSLIANNTASPITPNVSYSYDTGNRATSVTKSLADGLWNKVKDIASVASTIASVWPVIEGLWK